MREILGNENLKEHFITAVKQGKVSHAYILEGEKGCGKKTTAAAFASLLQCENEDRHGESCGTCTSCVMVQHRNHPDVIWVTHEKPGVISVGEIRQQIVNTIDVKPYKGPYKIYIVDEAEKMNPAAQNAILKTIEEPPGYAVILLLTTNRGAFLPTILSRCILLNMKPIPDETVKKYLMEHCEITEETASFCTGFSMGNIGKAQSAAVSEEFLELKETGMSILKYLHETEDYEIIEKIKAIRKWKDTIQDYLDIMLIWYRDVLVLKVLQKEEMLIYQLEYPYLRKQSELLRCEDINDILLKIDQTRAQLKANVNFDTAMEILHIEIRRKYITD